MFEGMQDNVPLGLNTPARSRSNSISHASSTSLPSLFHTTHASSMPPQTPRLPKKKTDDGIVLNPQPGESVNDPLNWPKWRRDVALLSLGFFCMLGGGMTPVLAAGFTRVSETFDVPVPRVALTTGLYMMGLGLGSVVASPTAILFGKRPVYLVGACLFIITSIWCAVSPNFSSLIVARIFMGFAVSPVECLPSASVAEIFFLHERAFRLGLYTLLLLGGKNLIPLVSAVIINALGWRWVFWMVAIVVGFGAVLLFFFVPETFWDRTPTRNHRPRKESQANLKHSLEKDNIATKHNDFGDDNAASRQVRFGGVDDKARHVEDDANAANSPESTTAAHDSNATKPAGLAIDIEKSNHLAPDTHLTAQRGVSSTPAPTSPAMASESGLPPLTPSYTQHYSSAPPKSFVQTLKPYSGRLSKDNWLKVACRPFILFAYPAILWSTVVYALSVGWLIVLSESVSVVYESKTSYGFTPLQAGLVYLSPFIGGVLGTAVAGKVSDIIVRWMSKRNGGIYEPEFRLVMAIPVALTTAMGLMGYGWSAEADPNVHWGPTIFFGVISFGCCLGSTTAITFAVDSYRQYAGEALVTLNFAKNILHGLVFSLFFNEWLVHDGSKLVFLCLGGVQLFFLLWTIPLYIYGRRFRLWTAEKNLMERF